MRLTSIRVLYAVAGMAFLAAFNMPAQAGQLSFTDFEGFTTDVSVDGQGGWNSGPKWDESVVDIGGNTVWRVSNAVTAGSFGDMPFAPRPGGLPTTPATDPINSNPASFAGESSTGAAFTRFFASFDFRSATGAAQSGLSVTVSPDNGQGGRQSFVDLEDNGSSLDVVTYDVDAAGNFVGPMTIANGLSYTDWHTLAFELLFSDGSDNDVANIFVDGSLVHTGTSWEQFYRFFQSALHPLGVPVQTLLFRISGTAAGNTKGGGFYIDNVRTAVSNVPEPGTLMLFAFGLIGLAILRRRRTVTAARAPASMG